MAAKYQPSNPVPKGVGFSIQICLKDNANPGSFKAAPTIAASGDFKCSGSSAAGSPGALTDMTVLPVVDPAGSIWVNVQFSASEMNFDQVFFQGIDQTNPKEWADIAFSINTCSVTRGQAGTALPAAAADAAGGLAISDAGGLDLDLKIGNLPSVAAGAAGGVFIAGSNAATTVAGLTTGALSCSTITASGAVAFQSTFAVTTSTSLAALSGTTVTFSGAVALQSTFAVTGATTLTGAVTASNAANNIVGIDVAKIAGTTQTAKDLGAINVTTLNTLSGHDPGATLGTGTSTLTQTQVSGGAYAINSSSFAFNAGLDFTTTQKAATLARVTLTDTATALGAAYDAAKTAATQTSVDDLPTNAELATSQAAADDATLAAIAALNNLSAAQVNAEVDTALADYDGPTHAELTSELATADDATLAAIGALNNPTTADIAVAVRDVNNGSPAAGSLGEAVRGADAKAADIQITLGAAGAGLTAADDAVMAAIAALNDFDPTTEVTIANVKKVNDIDIDGTGTSGDPWGPV